MHTIEMSDYTFGQDCYKAIEPTCKSYGASKVVLIGGKRALAASAPKIKAALDNSSIQILDEIVYGHEATMENVEALVSNPNVKEADILFGIGGGKAIDTVKTAALTLNKQVFSFPTICSNCSSATAIAVLYKEDGSMLKYAFPHCPVHIFIDPQVIVEAPSEYFWAGIGDALSKQCEVEYATQKADLDHTATLGLALAKACEKPLLEYGKQAMEDCKNHVVSKAVEEIILDILVSTGYVSNLTNQPTYYYNSSIAHAFYNGSTSIQREAHLHGEVVSFGVMVLFAYIKEWEKLDQIAKFNKSIGLPVTLKDIGLNESHISQIIEAAKLTNEWKSAIVPFEDEKFKQAILDADGVGETTSK